MDGDDGALHGCDIGKCIGPVRTASARLAQSVEHKALNLVVVGSSPTVGVFEKRGVQLRLRGREVIYHMQEDAC